MSSCISPEIEAIRSQVEFYFGLENLLQDAFLLSRMNSRMMVPLSMIFSFKKIRQLSSSFDQVLTAVQQSPNRLVVECDMNDGEWWIGPNPQACPDSRCTIVLSDVPDEVSVEDIEALTTAPLLHSYNFADGTWYATFQDKHAAKVAIGEMQRKSFKGVPVKAKLKVAPPQADLNGSGSSTLNRNAVPYQVPHRAPRTPNNTPVVTPSMRTVHGSPKPSPVAGCPLYVSRNPMAAQRNADAGKRGNALMSTFYAMSPVQQQMFMMNFMMQQQMLMQGARMEDSSGFVPPFQLNGQYPQQRPAGYRNKNRPEATNNGPVNTEAVDATDGRRKLQGKGTSNSRPGPPRMEALGADLPDSADSSNSKTVCGDNKDQSAKKMERRVELPLNLDPKQYPTLGQGSAPPQTEGAPLRGWAAAIAKAPVKVAKVEVIQEEANPNPRKAKQPKAVEESKAPNGAESTVSVKTDSAPAPADVDIPSVPRTYASLLAKSPSSR